jgi:hypothetical protein
MITQKVKVLLAGVCLLIVSAAFAQKKTKDNLSGKIYTVTVTESKKGKSGKPAKDEIRFRNGKVESTTVIDNMGFGNVKYELTVDSAYVSEGDTEETPYIEFEAIAKDKDDQEVKIVATVDGFGIEGYMELIDKKGKVKKHYDFVGAEKGKKPTKSKKKKGDAEESSGE